MFPLCHRHVGGHGVWMEAAPWGEAGAGSGVRCGPAWFPSTPPRRMVPLRAPIPSLASRLWGRSRVPVAPPAGNAALPCSRAGKGLRAVAVRSSRAERGAAPLARSPRPGRGGSSRPCRPWRGARSRCVKGSPVVPGRSPLFPSGGR